MKLRFLLLTAGLFLLYTGCLRFDEPDNYRNAEGVVLSGGQPVSNAEIHIRNSFDPGGFLVDENSNSSIPVEFFTSLQTEYTGNLYRYKDDTLLTTFLKKTFDAGQHTVNVPRRNLSNGIYAYEVVNIQRQGPRGLMFVRKPDSLLPGTIPFTTTDGEGAFTLDSDLLSFGDEFSSTTSNIAIDDSLHIMVVVDNQLVAKRRVRVKPNTDNFFEITID